MRKIKNLLLIIAVVVLAGCASKKLETGGAYAPTDAVTGMPISNPDLPFFLTDSAYRIAYSTVDAVFMFERDNRLMLWKLNPEIKRTLDKIRPQAVSANIEYLKGRAAYMANPTPPNLDILKQVLAKVQQLTQTALAVLPKGSV